MPQRAASQQPRSNRTQRGGIQRQIAGFQFGHSLFQFQQCIFKESSSIPSLIGLIVVQNNAIYQIAQDKRVEATMTSTLIQLPNSRAGGRFLNNPPAEPPIYFMYSGGSPRPAARLSLGAPNGPT